MNIIILNGSEVVKNASTTFNSYGRNKQNERVVWCKDVSLWVLGMYYPDNNSIIVVEQKTKIKTYMILLHELVHWLITKLGDNEALQKRWDLQKII